MSTKRRNAQKTFKEVIGEISQVQPKLPPDDYIHLTLTETDKINLIDGLVRIADLRRDKVLKADLMKIRQIPRDMWDKKHYRALLDLQKEILEEEDEETTKPASKKSTKKATEEAVEE